MALDDLDEELASPPRAIWSGLIAAVAVAGVVALMVAKSDDDGSSSHAAPPSTSFTPQNFDTPSATPSNLDECPSTVLCTKRSDLPDPTIAAVRSVIAGAEVVETRSILVVGATDLRPSVWFREIAARSATVYVELSIHQPQGGDGTRTSISDSADRQVADVMVLLPGYTVEIHADAPKDGAPSEAQLQRLARDSRLVYVQ